MTYEGFLRSFPLLISFTMFALICIFHMKEVIHIPLQNIDTSSASNMHQIITENFDLKVNLNFQTKIIEGEITHNLKAVSNEVSLLILDARNLEIENVFCDRGKPLEFIYSKWNGINEMENDVLVIKLHHTMSIGEKTNIHIKYRTSNNPSAVSWLNPSQTSGEFPFMYTQCESIHCRSIAPVMDTPSVKSTFSISITVPNYLAAYASGIQQNVTNSINEATYSFKQKIPVPVYLLAFAAGNIVKRNVGKRTGVLAEPEMIEKCSNELSDLEQYLSILENIFDPYIWGEYNIIILPKSFPY